MSLTTPQDIITFSLKAIGVLGVGQTAQAEDNTDAFDALNAMLGIWSRRRWLIWHLLDVYVQSTGAQSYTIGPSGAFNVPRPDRLESAFFRQYVSSNPNQIDYPMSIIDSREDYNLIALKTLSSNLPLGVFYDSAIPLGYIYPWPIPQSGLGEIHVSIKDTLTQFATYNQAINLPPEYTETIWTNLALRIAVLYPGCLVTDDLRGLARSSLETVRGANAQIPTLQMPRDLRTSSGVYNIFSDQVGTGTS